MFYVHEVRNCCVLAIFECRRGRLRSKISGGGQLAEVTVYFAMSGLPPEADTKRKGRHVRWVPITEVPSLNSIISSAVASREGGTERPRAFAVFRLMTNLKRVGWSMGQVSGLCAFQDPVDIADRAAEIIEKIRQLLVGRGGQLAKSVILCVF